jgi:hypothetical protein
MSPDAPDAALTTAEFERFRRLVLENPALIETLRAGRGQRPFAKATVELGRTHGILFTEGEVESALLRAKESWFERYSR